MNKAVSTSVSSFAGVGGLKIHTRAWRPAEGAPKAVVVISHGFNSHSGQYDWAASQLAAAGYAVHALDHRGRGHSEGERFYVQRFDDYVSDLAVFIQGVKAKEAGLPVFLLGHSAGGVIACGYALTHQAELKGLVCESFAFQVPVPAFGLALLKGLAKLAPHLGVFKLNNSDFSRDAAVVAAMNSDPLIANETQPLQTVAEMVRASERLKVSFGRITLPVLIVHGTRDKATLASGSQFFHAQAGSADKTLTLYQDHVHDLLSDVGKDGVLNDILKWLDARA